MDSHTSVIVAIFLVLMSPFNIGEGDVIYTEKHRCDDVKQFDALLHVINGFDCGS